MKLSDLPNAISILRILLVVPVVFTLLEREYGLALILFFIAGISDGLDGYLAKRNQWQSRLGSILDPVADKFLLVTCYIVLGWQAHIPLWLVFMVLARDVLIIAGAVFYHLLKGSYEMEPTYISKANTVMQIALVLIVVFSLGLYTLPVWIINSVEIVVGITTAVSGLVYLWIWGRKAIIKS